MGLLDDLAGTNPGHRVTKQELEGRHGLFESETGVYGKLRKDGTGKFTDHQLKEFKTMISGHMDADHRGHGGMNKKELEVFVKDLKTHKTFTPNQIARAEKALRDAASD